MRKIRHVHLSCQLWNLRYRVRAGCRRLRRLKGLLADAGWRCVTLYGTSEVEKVRAQLSVAILQL